MNRLDGKVALITGGNSGIGLATARVFVQHGAKVAITGRREKALDEAMKLIGGNAISILADASKISDNKKAIEQTVEAFGNIDILFLNAGIAKFVPISSISEEHFDEHFNTNVKGPFFTIKEALPYMNNGSTIITNTSVAGRKGYVGTSVYAASKAALRSLSRVLANELAEKNIRTMSIAPGPVTTDIFSKMKLSNEEFDIMERQFINQVPLGRFGSCDEIAETVLFMASDAASYINGIELNVDGGMSQI
ncbi:glucose 1-dehydrogenase [Fulvivirga sediminis]|uniref:Glucose 1-dehydrogenase n=1 Tax=Fulvivirga sediminis TaxID=2803949 RepID=A0A937F8K1_9BACT|nr:glucose 1-dehydrogenase [Fulvivirga sediminis]MBL3658457.1 glucose 1-dehydrogenase [Fulvivirga sediminis]